MVFILCLISSYSSLSVQKKLAITECLTLILMLGILAWSRQYGWYKRGNGKGHSFPSRLVMVCVYRKTSATRCWWSFFFYVYGLAYWCLCCCWCFRVVLLSFTFNAAWSQLQKPNLPLTFVATAFLPSACDFVCPSNVALRLAITAGKLHQSFVLFGPSPDAL